MEPNSPNPKPLFGNNISLWTPSSRVGMNFATKSEPGENCVGPISVPDVLSEIEIENMPAALTKVKAELDEHLPTELKIGPHLEKSDLNPDYPLTRGNFKKEKETVRPASTQDGCIEEKETGWYSSSKSYRSVAYKTWTVGGARKFVNYYHSPIINGNSNSNGEIGNGKIVDGSDSEEGNEIEDSKTPVESAPSTSTENSLEIDWNLKNGVHSNFPPNSDSTSDRFPPKHDSDLNKMPSWSKDGINSNFPPNSDSTSDRFPPKHDSDLNKMPSWSKDGISSNFPPNPDSTFDRFPPKHDSDLNKMPSWSKDGINSNFPPNPDSISYLFPPNTNLNLIPSRSSNDVRIENTGSSKYGNIEIQSDGNNAGDCFSSQDYFKFTMQKRLHQQGIQNRRHFQDYWNFGNKFEYRRNLTPPLSALDRDIGSILDRNEILYGLMSPRPVQQNHWYYGGARNGRLPDYHYNPHSDSFIKTRTSLVNPSKPWIRIPPLHLSSSSFSSSSTSSCSSSTSSSMSPASQGTVKIQKRRPSVSPLAICVDGDGDRTPSEISEHSSNFGWPYYAGLGVREKMKREKVDIGHMRNGAVSPFRDSREAVEFLKKELVNIRKNDHQILSQLKALNAEISRRKSETDAVGSTDLIMDTDNDLQTGTTATNGTNKANAFNRLTKRASERNSRPGLFNYANRPLPTLPHMPNSSQLNFKTL